MNSAALFPDAPTVITEGGRQFVCVPWEAGDALRMALAKHGCPTTLCLDPENRQARLELWPGVTAEAVRAVLDARQSVRREGSAAPAPASARVPTSGPAALISV